MDKKENNFKTLWMGCSHSTGTYNLNNDIIDRNYAIPVVVANELGIAIKSFNMPGNGLFGFASMLEYLIQKNKMGNIQNIIIQQTSEPRINFYESQRRFFNGVEDYMDNDNPYGHRLYEKAHWSFFEHVNQYNGDKFFSTTQGKSDFLDYLDDLHRKLDVQKVRGREDLQVYEDNMYVDMCYRAIQNYCLLHNIKLYSWAWWTTYRDTDYIRSTRIKLDGKYDCMMDYFTAKYGKEKLYKELVSHVGWHPTKQIVTEAGRLVAKELLNAGFKVR